jgi:hypothetical protein
MHSSDEEHARCFTYSNRSPSIVTKVLQDRTALKATLQCSYVHHPSIVLLKKHIIIDNTKLGDWNVVVQTIQTSIKYHAVDVMQSIVLETRSRKSIGERCTAIILTKQHAKSIKSIDNQASWCRIECLTFEDAACLSSDGGGWIDGTTTSTYW